MCFILVISLWNVNGLKNTKLSKKFSKKITLKDQFKLDKIKSSIELFNPNLLLFTETHLDPTFEHLHPVKSIAKKYPFFSLGCSSSCAGGVAILSKTPITVHYKHKSGNLVHFSLKDDDGNSISFIHCYASPKKRRYYFRLILKRSNVIPGSIITGDLNTDIESDSYFKTLLFNPLCLIPSQDITSSKPTFIPRNKTSPKALDWLLFPSIFCDFNITCSILPQTSPPISDHLLTTVTLSRQMNLSESETFINRKTYISSNLFKSEQVRDALRLASKRFSDVKEMNSIDIVESYRYNAFCFLSDLTRDQAVQNTRLIRQAKNLCNQPHSKDTCFKLNEIISERIQSSRDRFLKYISESRHSPSKAMTLLSKESSVSSRPKADDAKTHFEFWKDHFNKNIKIDDKYLNYFLDYVDDRSKLTDDNHKDLEKPITVDEVVNAIKNAPSYSSAGIDGLAYEVYKFADPSFVSHLTEAYNFYYSHPGSLPPYVGASSISLLHKKGNVSDPANFRPISLLPTFWKILSSIFAHRFTFFLRKIISPEQVGFVKGRNIEVNLHTIDSIISEFPNIYTVAVDFEKAFDSLNHSYLLEVLKKFNFPPKFCELIKHFLFIGKSCLVLGNFYSSFFTVVRGVRQGDPLSGLLFIVALEPLLRALDHNSSSFAPRLKGLYIPDTAYADDLTIFVRKAKKIKLIQKILFKFEKASGLKVNNIKTQILHNTEAKPKIRNWQVVKEIKILGILFPTSNRKQIKDSISKLHEQLAFWKRLKIPLYTKLILLNSYIKLQYVLPILDFKVKDIKKINKLINWGISNHNSEFKPLAKYNPLFSTRRCFLSNQNFGFNFLFRLQQAKLARIARIIALKADDYPTIYYAQRLHTLTFSTVKSFSPIPAVLDSHFKLWKKLNIKFKFGQPARSSTFKSLISFDPPHLHPTPKNVPDLDQWPVIRRLPVPPSTKSFLLKVYMNALPTADRVKFSSSKILCPLCSEDLTSNHFFEGKCIIVYAKKIFDWCDKISLPRPKPQINFDNPLDLIFMNCLWKTICKARHDPKASVFSLQYSAKHSFTHDLQIAQLLYDKDYKVKLQKLMTDNLHFRYNFCDLVNIDNKL